MSECYLCGQPAGEKKIANDDGVVCDKCADYWGTKEDWEEIEKMAPSSAEFMRAAKYLRETGQDCTDEPN